MALWGIGTKFMVGDGAESEQFVAIGEITNIGPPGMTTDVQDATTLDSEDGYEEKVPTIIRTGEGTLTFNFDPEDEDQKDFLNYLQTRAKKNFRVLYPDGVNFYQFAAYVTGYEPGEITPDGFLSVSVTLSATGKPTFDKESDEES